MPVPGCRRRLASLRPCLHTEAGLDLRADAVGAGEENALPVVQTVLNGNVGADGEVQEHFAIRRLHLQPFWEGCGVSRFRYRTAARVVEMEINKGAARFIQADVEDYLTCRCVDEDD